jgi:phosphoenolpyruvate carboxykinase (ATP)
VDWGEVNREFSAARAQRVFEKLEKFCSVETNFLSSGRIGPFVIEVKSPSAWHSVFVKNMFRSEPAPGFEKNEESKKIQVFHAPLAKPQDFDPDYQAEALILLDLHELKVAVIGSSYAGEIKKSAFSMINYLIPDRDILPMHASANCLDGGKETCVFFGLSGTGKTTLSAAHDRWLIGDDELLWTETGISNLEGGCYAKLIDLDRQKEPEIYSAINRFGSIMENVGFESGTREVLFADRSRTENTRGSYSLEAFERVFDQRREAEAPKNVVFLVADAYGALPAVAKLNSEQAQYHFLAGYTAKVAGTELGVKEPQAVFSSGFGEAFLPRPAAVYAKLLAKRARAAQTNFWLLNTGWFGGYGKGDRFPIAVSRELLRQIQTGQLSSVEFDLHPVFGFSVPLSCPNVDRKYLASPTGEGVMSLAQKFVTRMKKFEPATDKQVFDQGGPRLQGN